MTPIDICLVAGRRPSLLERTLSSFTSSLFNNFEVANFYANIDPIFGGAEDEEKTVAVIRSFFPNAHIKTPEKPSFCAAVKHNWESTQSPVIFHLEDDWVINEYVKPADIFSIFDDNDTKQVSLNNFHKHWNYKNGPFHHQWLRKKILGVKFRTGEPFPCFTTSPSFLNGDFARRAGALMDIRYDPEKQFYNAMNMPLKDYVKPYKNYIYGEDKPFIITDIGREWRDARNVTKTFVNGASVWESSNK